MVTDVPFVASLPALTELPVICALFGFVCILTIALYLGSRGANPEDFSSRLNRFSRDSGGMPATRSTDTGKSVNLIESLFRPLNKLFSRTSIFSHYSDQLSRADLKIKPLEWLSLLFFIGLIGGLLFAFRVGEWIAIPIGVLVAYIIGTVYLHVRQSGRKRSFNKQLGDTLLLLSNALRAGYSFSQAMQTIAQNASPPISEEFSRATREIMLGISVDESLLHMVDRNQSEDFDLMVTAVQIQRVVGGNLAEILDTIAVTIRERVRIEGEIRTITAQARTSGYIITLLPLILALFLYFVEPTYFKPLVTTSLGFWLIGISVVSIAIGYGIIQRIVKIEV